MDSEHAWESDVSIIVPLYHGKKYIPQLVQMAEECKKEAGDSVKIELILSNDDPDEKIDESIFSDVIDVLVINTTKNRGIQGARIEGLAAGRGKYVVFLDQDDIVHPHYICSQLLNIGDADAIICKVVNGGKPFYDHNRHFEEMISCQYMFSVGNGILSPGQVLMRRKAVSQFWQKNILQHNGADDWLLWLCMLYEGRRFAQNQEILFEHVLNSANCSENVFGMYQSEKDMYRLLERQEYFDIEYLVQLKQAIQKGIEIRLRELDRLKAVTRIYDMWLDAKIEMHSVAQALKRAGYHNVAIYGMGKIGMRLYQEIKTEVEVKCFIDRNAAYLKTDIPVYMLEETIPKIDLVIIALNDRGNKIWEEVTSRLHVMARSIENILQDILAEE